MQTLKNLLSLLLFFVAAIYQGFPEIQAQGNFYKFPVTQEGIYKITAVQASQLGASSVDELAVFGYPGMLPQQLDSSSWKLKEIPVKNINGDLFFYLSAAETIEISEEQIHYQTHHYTDTLYYLVQSQKKHKVNISHQQSPPSKMDSLDVLYRVIAYKNEIYNLLSSGRKWYGERVFGGESILLNFEEKPAYNLPLYYQGKLMAQSFSTSKVGFSINQHLVESITLPAITQSKYGVKGQETRISGWTMGPNAKPEIQVKLHFETSDRNGTGYLDYFMLGCPFPTTNLPSGIFYNLKNNPFGLKASIQQEVWDISDFFDIRDLTSSTPILSYAHKIAVFTADEAKALSGFERVNLDLKSVPLYTELVIITHPLLKSQAERLATHKNNIGITTQVVTIPEVYNSFGYGNSDITAIRNFLAFHYHRGGQLKNVLLFGKGTFDYKNKMRGRPNLVPTYSSRSSLNPLTTYSSDDYFGFMDFEEGLWEETSDGDHDLDIGVGRLPVINVQEAKNVVDKIIHYESAETNLGDWKRKVLFVADDGDNNVHLKDSESLAGQLSANHPELILEKLYLDNFDQENSGNVQKSPAAKATFETLMDSSFLLVNYIGHGNETSLMGEELFTIADLNNWRENPRLPVFITATCEFGRHDSPLIRSGAEELLIAEKRGAIALLSTGRPAFSNINFNLNQAFIHTVFEKENGQALTLGEIFKRTKNKSLNGPLNRNFSLLGDPSLALAIPELSIQANYFLDKTLQAKADTLKPLRPILYKGSVTDPLTGAIMETFNGPFEILVSNKPVVKTTLGNESPPGEYVDEQVYLYRGQGKVVNGNFEGKFILPVGLDFSFEEGTVRFFAKGEKWGKETFGAEKILVGGISTHPRIDSQGPEIRLSTKQDYGTQAFLSSSTVILNAALKDSSGININPLLPDQNISVVINNGEKIILNEYYKAQDGSFTQGIMEFPVRGLKEGLNLITFKAWDNVGNSSFQAIHLQVKGSEKVKITSVHTFPNPASTVSRFLLTHNRIGENLVLQVKIFSLTGSEIYSLSRRFPKAGPKLEDVSWIFMQSKSNFPKKGTYLYVLELKSEKDGSTDQKSGKIIIQ